MFKIRPSLFAKCGIACLVRELSFKEVCAPD